MTNTKKFEKPRLQIIRGLPGSGKTTLALEHFPHLMRVETDMFFTRKGEYTFTIDLNRKAVKWYNKMVRDLCKTGMDFVVTGVFSAHTERLVETVTTAIDAGYDIYIKTLHTNYGSIHGVPKEHYDAMKSTFVAQKTLKKFYVMRPQVHFGLMPQKG